MTRIRFGSLLLLSLAPAAQTALRPPAVPPALPTAAALQAEFGKVAQCVWPGVVTVRALARRPAGAPAPVEDATPEGPMAGWMAALDEAYPGFDVVSAGSGFFCDPSGDVLTCHHVVQKPDGSPADLIELQLNDGLRVLAELVGAEPTVNLAILHPMVFLAGQSAEATWLRFGDSEAVETGQYTLAFGNPDGPEKFFTPGVFVARPSRDCYQDQLSAFYMQLAMVAHPQACGGPVVNLAGEVVGVLSPRRPIPGGSLTEPKLGVEMAMPSKIVTGLYEAIKTARSFQSPWLGFAVMSRAELATVRGLEAFNAMDKPRAGILIENVFRPSPAAAAGIEPGDFLVKFGATQIFNPVDFQKCLYLAGIGTEVTLEIYRRGETSTRTLKIERRPPEATPR